MMLNAFALVAYIPDPLASFLDRLRAELVPGYRTHAHVTILPPRPLFVAPATALAGVRSCLREIVPFEVEAGGVQMFPRTFVIHLAVGTGRAELVHLHDALNGGALAFEEPFSYHPHITLAQGLLPEDADGTHEKARRWWAEYSGSRKFTVQCVTLVQSEDSDDWMDLAECRLGGSE